MAELVGLEATRPVTENRYLRQDLSRHAAMRIAEFALGSAVGPAQHGLTQAELAERCAMDQGDISRIERGSASPMGRTLQRIAAALDADVRLS